MMNEDIKTRWVAALRSREYVQGPGYLRQVGTDGARDRFCCLGVLCELAVQDGIVTRSDQTVEKILNGRRASVYTYTSATDPSDDNVAVLPHAVAVWANISADGYQPERLDGQVCPDKEEGDSCADPLCGICNSQILTELNDGDEDSHLRPVPFTKIADVIEKWF